MAGGRRPPRVTAADFPGVVAAYGDWRVCASPAGRFYVQRRRSDGSFRSVGWCASESEALARLAELCGSAELVRPGRPVPAVVAQVGRLRVLVPAEADAYRVEWRDPGGVWRLLRSARDRASLLDVVLAPRKHSHAGRVVRSLELRMACLALPERPADWWPAS